MKRLSTFVLGVAPLLASAQPRPKAPTRFSADLVGESGPPGRVVYDRERQAFLQEFHHSFASDIYGPEFQANVTILHLDNATFDELNGQCRLLPADAGFHDPFAFLSTAVLKGQQRVLGQRCWLWASQREDDRSSACFADGRVLQLVYSAPSWFGGRLRVYNLTLASFQPSVNSSDLAVPSSCKGGGARLCPGGGRVIAADIFVFHPSDDFNISGQDVSDFTGEVAFLCGDLARGGAESAAYGAVSKWSMSLWSEWGQYALCNDRVPGKQGTSTCFGGGPGFHVGHAAAWDAAPGCGQCQENGLIGEWYSLPEGGRCQTSLQTLGRDCTWRAERRVATADRRCLLQDGRLLNVCSQELGRPPFVKAAAAFKALFESCAHKATAVLVV